MSSSSPPPFAPADVVKEIDGSRGAYAGRGIANAGRVCGMVGTLLLAGAAVLVFAAVASSD